MGTFNKLEEIEVWKRGCRLAVDVYKLTSCEKLSKEWGLRDQIRRSSISIPSNIAEGFERDSTAEFKRFLQIAKGSCGELRTQLYILKALELLNPKDVENFLTECIEISSMIQSLVVHLKTLIKS
jgi:four helix bundle protein